MRGRLTPKALTLLRVIRGCERRVRQLALKADYRVARPPGGNPSLVGLMADFVLRVQARERRGDCLQMT
jgi:hypothetical protein